MSRTWRRAVRTAFQAGLAGATVTVIHLFIYPMTAEQLAAIGAFLTIVASMVQNGLEEAEIIPNMLKDPHEPKAEQDEGRG